MDQTAINSMCNPICRECGDSITNPICHECLQKQLFAFLADKITEGKLKAREYGRLKTAVNALTKRLWGRETGITCIKCKESLAVCPYCYTRHIQKIFSQCNSDFLISSFSFCFKFV